MYVSGLKEDIQMGILHDMEALVNNMFFTNKKTGLLVQKPFQKGLLVSIKSVIGLFKELQSEGLTYILTTRVNQDALENSFSSLRYMGGNNTHPSASNFCERIRLLCVSKNIQFVVTNPSVEYSNECQFLSSDIIDKALDEISNTEGKHIFMSQNKSHVFLYRP